MPKLNLKGVGRQEPVPADSYECTVTGQKHDKVKTGDYKDADRCNIELTVADGEHAGRKLYRSYTLHEDWLWSFKEDMLLLGADEKMLEDDDVESEEIAKAVLGEQCVAEVTINEWTDNNNNLRRNNQVSRIHEPGWS